MPAAAFRSRPAAAYAIARPAPPTSRSIGVSCLRRTLRFLALFALTSVGAGSANAQLSGSISVVSDYRFRGVSLSDGEPAAQGTVVYDHASGLYVGLFASTVRLASDRATGFQTTGQAGYALRVGDLAWDAGTSYSEFTEGGLGYADFYIGAASTDWSARLSYAPRYFGQPYAALYAELNLTPRSEHALAPLLHFGLLSAHPPPSYGERTRWDARVGVAYNHEALTVQLSWGTVSRIEDPAGPSKSAWVLRVTAWM
jgi:uncharacterized protein (TIGR02001 family)